MNTVLLVDESISKTFLVYKLLRKLKLSATIHIERGGTNALGFVQDFALTYNNECPDLIIISSELLQSDASHFLLYLRRMNFSNKDKMKILATGSLPKSINYNDITVLPDPVTEQALIAAIENPQLKTFAA